MKALDLRAKIPALQDGLYLNFGAHGPSPRPVVEAAESFLRTHDYEVPIAGDPYEAAYDTFDRARETVAEHIGCSPDAVALTESTTNGLNAIAGAISWQPGDVVVHTDLEHPAGILPWQRLEAAGVERRVVETRAGRLDPSQFADVISDAKLACFSALTWTHGTRLPVEELVEITHEAGAYALVDAVQLPGQTSVDVTEWGADAVAASGQKWLLGLWGGGFLYVDPSRIDEFEPGTVGYRSVTSAPGKPMQFHRDARRFEVASTNPAPHHALARAIEEIEAVGIDDIESRIVSLVERLRDGIPREQYLSPNDPESGLVTLDADDPAATVKRCRKEGIVIRELPYPDAVRLSIHAVNTTEEIDRVIDILNQEW